MSNKEILIIGAGVIGCSIAYHLAKRGVPSQVIERDSIGARASGKSWAVWTYPPHSLRMEGQPPDALFSMPVGSVAPFLQIFWLGYNRLPDVALDLKEKGGIDIEYGELPRIDVAFSENDEKTLKEVLSIMNNQGYHEAYWIDEKELKAIYPDINPLARGGFVEPWQQVEPYRYTLGLAQAAEKMGAEFKQGEVVKFRHKDSKITGVVLATGTEIQADVVVLSTGPWSGQVTSKLGKELPVLINLEQCLRMQVPKRLPPYALCSPKLATIIPKVNGEVILGHAGSADMQTSLDVSLTTDEAKMMLINDAIDILPNLSEAKLIEHRGDFECWSPPPRRPQPVVGRLPQWDNAYIATRFGTMGMMMSLGAGQMMAELIIAGGRFPERYKNMMEVLSPAKLEW